MRINSYVIITPMFKLDHESGSEADFRLNRYEKYGLFYHGKTNRKNRIPFLHHFLP